MNTAEVIKEAQKGSASAQKLLFENFRGPLQYLCYRYVRNAEDSEECLLNGFRTFFYRLKHFSFTGNEALSSWIRKIMINECLMFLRSKKVFNMVTEMVIS